MNSAMKHLTITNKICKQEYKINLVKKKSINYFYYIKHQNMKKNKKNKIKNNKQKNSFNNRKFINNN